MMLFRELTEKEWTGLSFKCQSFLQSKEMYQRYLGERREVYLAGVEDDARGIVAAGLMVARPWRMGKKIFRVAGGWLMDYDADGWQEVLAVLTRGAREFCQRRGGMVLEISPNIVARARDSENQVVEGEEHLEVKRELVRLGYKYLGEYEQAKWQYVLELKGRTAEGLFSEFRAGHRWQIRRAEKDGVRVRELGEGELGVLKAIAAEAGERHGFLDPEMEYYRSMKRYFGDKVKFVVAEIPAEKVREERKKEAQGVAGASAARSDEARVAGASEKAEANDTRNSDEVNGYVPLAAAMFVNDGREMVYLYSGTVWKYQKYGGSHLIQWEMMQEALKAGCEKYNFYGVYPVAGDGVYKFKQGFRGHVEELLGTFALPIGAMGRVYVGRIKEKEFREVR